MRVLPRTAPQAAQALEYVHAVYGETMKQLRTPRRLQRRGGSPARWYRVDEYVDRIIMLIGQFFWTNFQRHLQVHQLGRREVLIS